MKYHSAIKRDEIESFVVRCVKLEPIIQGEISEEEENPIWYINTHMWNLEK